MDESSGGQDKASAVEVAEEVRRGAATGRSGAHRRVQFCAWHGMSRRYQRHGNFSRGKNRRRASTHGRRICGRSNPACVCRVLWHQISEPGPRLLDPRPLRRAFAGRWP